MKHVFQNWYSERRVSRCLRRVPGQPVARRVAAALDADEGRLLRRRRPDLRRRLYRRALLGALRELGADISEEAFEAEYELRRAAQAGITRPDRRGGSSARTSTRRQVTPLVEQRVALRARGLFPDVLPALRSLSSGYRLGVIANQPAATRAALDRDGVGGYLDVWALSGDVGLAKPRPASSSPTRSSAPGCRPDEAVYVGDRLDNDIRPAQTAGLRTLWLLRARRRPGRPPRSLRRPTAFSTRLPSCPRRSRASGTRWA